MQLSPGPSKPIYRQRWFIVTGVILALMVLGSIADDDRNAGTSRGTTSAAADRGASDAAPASLPSSPYFQPAVETTDGRAGPSWATTFGLHAPPGSWEERTAPDGSPYCVLVNEDDYVLRNDRGIAVVYGDSEPRVTFGRSDSQINADGSCQIIAVVMGDYNDDLGDAYTVSNGRLSATFTPRELFSGQDAGRDTVKHLQ